MTVNNDPPPIYFFPDENRRPKRAPAGGIDKMLEEIKKSVLQKA